MPNPGWTTDEQETLLLAHLPAYKTAKSERKFTNFWATLKEEWFTAYPEIATSFPGRNAEDLNVTEAATMSTNIEIRVDQLKTWFRWRTNPAARTGAKRQRQTKVELDLDSGSHRQYKPEEMYSKLVYKEKIQPEVEARIISDNIKGRGSKLNLIKEVTRDMYLEEDDEMKARVQRALVERAKRLEEVEVEGERTPDQYLRSIEDLPAILTRFLETQAKRSGWAFSLLMGGPHPGNNGEITVASLHFGESSLGNNFAQSHTNFDKNFMESYAQFVSGLYPESVRLARVLPGKDLELQYTEGFPTPEPQGVEHRELDGAHLEAEPGKAIKAAVKAKSKTEAMVKSKARSKLKSEKSKQSKVASSTVTTESLRPLSPLDEATLISPLNEPTAFNVQDPLLNPTMASSDLGSTTSGVQVNYTELFPMTTPPACDIQLSDADVPSFPSWPDWVDMGDLTSKSFDMLVSGEQTPSGIDHTDDELLKDIFPREGLNIPQLSEFNWRLLGFPNPSATMADSSSGGSATTIGFQQTSPALGITLSPSTPAPEAPAWPCSAPQLPFPGPSSSLLPPSPDCLDAMPNTAQAPWLSPSPPTSPPPPIPVPAPALVPPSVLLPSPLPAVAVMPNVNEARRSSRPVMPSKRTEELNRIGENNLTSINNRNVPIEKENILPGKIPAWAQLAHNHLLMRDLGEEWETCVAAWFIVETALKFGDVAGAKGALPAIGDRPEEWAKWAVKSRGGERQYHAIPTIHDSAEFGIAITSWWNAMQPEFRRSEERAMPLPVYDDEECGHRWLPLRKGGPNGLVSVLTLLVWWGQALTACTEWQEESGAEWKAVVVDVTRALEKIGSIGAESQKRKSTTSAGHIPKRRRMVM